MKLTPMCRDGHLEEEMGENERERKQAREVEGGTTSSMRVRKHPAGNGSHPGKYLSLLVMQRGSQSSNLALSYFL